jgi:hypothetical protein
MKSSSTRRAIRSTAYLFFAAMLMGEGFGQGNPISGCASCTGDVIAANKREYDRHHPDPGPATASVPRWSARAEAGKRSFTFAADRPARTFTVRVETNVAPERLAQHELSLGVSASYPAVTSSGCTTKCCQMNGDCTCLADLDQDGNSQFAYGSFGSAPGTSSLSSNPANSPGCYVGAPTRLGRPARTFVLRRSTDPSTWTCDATTGRCATEVQFTLTARDPTARSYTGVLQVAGKKHSVVPYVPERWPVSLSFGSTLTGTGAATPPDGLLLTLTVLEP